MNKSFQLLFLQNESDIILLKRKVKLITLTLICKFYVNLFILAQNNVYIEV